MFGILMSRMRIRFDMMCKHSQRCQILLVLLSCVIGTHAKWVEKKPLDLGDTDAVSAIKKEAVRIGKDPRIGKDSAVDYFSASIVIVPPEIKCNMYIWVTSGRETDHFKDGDVYTGFTKCCENHATSRYGGRTGEVTCGKTEKTRGFVMTICTLGFGGHKHKENCYKICEPCNRFGTCRPHGYGKMNYKDGSFYVGEWSEGKRCGKGTMQNSKERGEAFTSYNGGKQLPDSAYIKEVQVSLPTNFRVEVDPKGSDRMLYTNTTTKKTQWDYPKGGNLHRRLLDERKMSSAELFLHRRNLTQAALLEAKDVTSMSKSQLALHRRRLIHGINVSPIMADLMDQIDEAAKCA